MRQKIITAVKEANVEEAPVAECKHYWVINSADGPTSQGWCKFCGAKREFLNSLPDFTVVRRHTSFLDMPELEPDKKQSSS